MHLNLKERLVQFRIAKSYYVSVVSYNKEFDTHTVSRISTRINKKIVGYQISSPKI